MHDASDGHQDLHWPSGFTPDRAHSFCQAEAVVASPCARVFALLTDVVRWPEWVPGITEVRSCDLSGTYTMQIRGHRFEVIVGEHVPPRRLGWSGIGAGVQLYQAWLLTAVDGGTHVVTGIVVRGPAAKSADSESLAWAEGLNARWLARLKRRTESAPTDGDS